MTIKNLTVAVALIGLTPAAAVAGFITTQAAGVTAIYSQASFEEPIQIRFNPGLSFVRPDLLIIDDAAEQNALFALAPDPFPIVDAFYVDTIRYCFGAAPSGTYVGCAQLPGHELFVDSIVTAFSGLGPTILGHELGHDLGLSHVGDFSSVGNLMNPYLNSTVLSSGQAAAVFNSPLIQTDPATGARFVSITPIAIIGGEALPPSIAPVPEPSSLALMAVALGLFLLTWGCRKYFSRVIIF